MERSKRSLYDTSKQIMKHYGISYVSYDPNFNKATTGNDCAVRALSKFLRISWREAYRMLSDAAMQIGEIPSNVIAMTNALVLNSKFKFEEIRLSGYRAIDWIIPNIDRKAIIGIEDHAFCIDKGVIYDTRAGQDYTKGRTTITSWNWVFDNIITMQNRMSIWSYLLDKNGNRIVREDNK